MHLILTEKNIRIGKYKNMFKITGDGKILKTIPSGNLSYIIIFTQGFSISDEALSLASQQNINLTVCKPYGKPISFIQPVYNHPHIQNRWSQYIAIQNGLGIQIAKQYIQTKIENQFQLLCRYKTYLPHIENTLHNTIYALLQKLKSIDHKNIPYAKQQIMTIEAHASSIYWSYFKQLVPSHYNFTRRTHRYSKDPVNSALNFGYGILYSECFRALTLAGLDPFAGFLHTIQNNKQSLVFDFIEPLRQPLVDTPLLASLRQGINIHLQKNGLLEKETIKKLSTLYIKRLYESIPSDPNTNYQKYILLEAIKLAKNINHVAQTQNMHP